MDNDDLNPIPDESSEAPAYEVPEAPESEEIPAESTADMVDSVEEVPIAEVTSETLSSPEDENAPPLQAADADAAADIARVPRAAQFRAQRRTRLSMLPVGVLLAGVGGLLLAETLAPGRFAPSMLIGIIVAGIGLTLLLRFFLNGRRERGLCLSGLILLIWTGLGVLTLNGAITIAQWLGFALIGLGLAILITFFFERAHERGLILPALLLMTAGGAALPILTGLIPPELLSILSTYWSLFLLAAALALLPLAIRPRQP